jgi:hypothetical protein
MKILRVIIAGGRNFDDYDFLKEMCDWYLSEKVKEGYHIEIVSGAQRTSVKENHRHIRWIGADYFGEKYSYEKEYDLVTFPAMWKIYKKKAGPIRNRQMAEYADVLIVFEGGNGTANMIKSMKKLGKPVRQALSTSEKGVL